MSTFTIETMPSTPDTPWAVMITQTAQEIGRYATEAEAEAIITTLEALTPTAPTMPTVNVAATEWAEKIVALSRRLEVLHDDVQPVSRLYLFNGIEQLIANTPDDQLIGGLLPKRRAEEVVAAWQHIRSLVAAPITDERAHGKALLQIISER